MEVPRLVERFSDSANKELDETGADLEAENPRVRAGAIRNLGALEKNYLQGMREAVDRLRRKLDSASN